MDFLNNEPEQIQLRKSQNTLIIVGNGTILFSIWSAVKMLGLFFILENESVEGLMGDLIIEGFDDEISYKIRFWITLFILLLIILISVIARVYVGRSAIAEGRGARRGNLYLFLAVIFIILSATTVGESIIVTDTTENLGVFTPDQSLSTIIIELTSMVMMIEMVISAIRVRKLRKSIKHAER